MATLDSTTAHTTAHDDPLFSPEQIAKYVGVSIETIRRAYRAKKLATQKIGRLVRIRRSWRDAWIDQGAPTM